MTDYTDLIEQLLTAWRSVRDSIAAAAEAQQAGPNTGVSRRNQ